MIQNVELTSQIKNGASIIKDPSLEELINATVGRSKGDPLVEVMILSKDLELWTRVAQQSSISFLYELYNRIPNGGSISLPQDITDILKEALSSYIDEAVVKPQIENVDLSASSNCDAAIRKVNIYAFALDKGARYRTLADQNNTIFETRCPCSYMKRSGDYRDLNNHWKDVFEKLRKKLSSAKEDLVKECPNIRQLSSTDDDDDELIPISKVNSFFNPSD